MTARRNNTFPYMDDLSLQENTFTLIRVLKVFNIKTVLFEKIKEIDKLRRI